MEFKWQYISLLQLRRENTACGFHGQVMTHSVRQIFHLREICCPSGEKGIIYSKVGVDIFFFRSRNGQKTLMLMVASVFVPFLSSFLLFPFCLLIVLCNRRDSTLILASLIAILAANPHPLLFFFCAFMALLEAPHSSGKRWFV